MAQAFVVFVTRGRQAFRVRTTSIFWAVSSLFAIASPAQQSLVREQTRFQILSSGLIRLEYSPHRKFVDAASVDEDARRSMRSIANEVFIPDEIRCHLALQAAGQSRQEVMARPDFGAASVPASAVNRSLDGHGFIYFGTQTPFPLRPGAFDSRKATLKWGGGQAEVTRDVQWRSKI